MILHQNTALNYEVLDSTGSPKLPSTFNSSPFTYVPDFLQMANLIKINHNKKYIQRYAALYLNVRSKTLRGDRKKKTNLVWTPIRVTYDFLMIAGC